MQCYAMALKQTTAFLHEPILLSISEELPELILKADLLISVSCCFVSAISLFDQRANHSFY